MFPKTREGGPQPEGENVSRRPVRALRDLASIFEAVDQINAPAAGPLQETPVTESPENIVPSPAEINQPHEPPAPPARARRIPDLSSLYESDSAPATSPAPARIKPDLSTLYDTEPASSPAASPARSLRTPDLSLLDEPAAQTQPAPRARKIPDLSTLYEVESPAKLAPASPSDSARADLKTSFHGDEDEATSGLVIPPDLERFVSPDLWRRLNSADPPRGALINALDRVRSVLSLLSTFLPNHLVQEKMRRPVPGLVSGQMLNGTLLFSDVSGFTALSERLQALGPKGAERLTEIMNRYFARMIEIIAWSGGTLLKFAGDATLVYFPGQPNEAQANWAVRAGQRMLRAVTAFGSDFSGPEALPGGLTLKMKIGIATGEFLAASVGSAKRMEYVVLGPAVAQTLAAEGASSAAGQLVIDAATRAALEAGLAVSEHKGGFALVGATGELALDDFEIRAETRRARGAIPWSASPHALLAQADVALRQIAAILPYLPPEVVERVVMHGQRAQFASQYRPTTVIFCNFWGYESLLSAWGAAGVQRVTSLLNAYFSAINEIISRYGGIISRIDPYSRGTKLLILFGAPVAHEDDPQRAVSAALSMNAELETLNDTWRRKFARHLPPEHNAPLLQHRIGITTGVTFAGQVGSPTRREYTVMGDEVNLSARLMAAADPGQILLSLTGEVMETVVAYFQLAPLSAIRVKGKSKAISVHQVQGPREDLLASRVLKRGRLVGRAQELAQAETILQLAMNGDCTLFTLSGPAGIGKSHLADELLRHAEQRGARVLFNPCPSYTATSPYAGWSGLLRSLAGITASDYLPEVHQRKLRQMVRELGLPESTLQPLATLMGLKASPRAADPTLDEPSDDLLQQVRQGRARRRSSALEVWDQLETGESSESGQVWQAVPAHLVGRERETIYSAVADLLAKVTQSAPLVVFFEDAHWMDPQTRDLLAFLAGHASHLSVLFLLAQRSDTPPAGPELGQVMTLGALTPDETSELVAHLLVADLAPVIHAQSSGNPLFVEEITRWFRRTRNINAEELASVLQSSNVLQKLVLSGLESLPEAQQQVAMAASVIGSEFRTGEVQTLLPPEIDPVTLSLHLRGLARARLIALTEAGADARYSFQQTLVRDVLYQSLPFEKRRDLHGRLAAYLSSPLSQRRALHARLSAALEITPGADPAQKTETLAAHYELAEAWLEAARCLEKAGDQARTQGALAQATAYYTRALADIEKAPTGKEPVERASLKLRLQVSQGDAALRASDPLAAVQSYEAAGAGAGLALAYRLALVLPLLKRAEEGEAQLRRAIQTSPESAPPEALLALAWLAARAMRPDSAECIAACRAQFVQPEAASDAWTACAQALLHDLSGEWQAARTAYLALDRRIEAAWVLLRAGEDHLQRGQLDEALLCCQQAAQSDLPPGEEAAFVQAAAAYRQAELHWRLAQPEESRQLLAAARAALTSAAPALAAEGQAAIQQALKGLASIRAGKRPWPLWRGQAFEDRLRIQLIFRG